LKKGFPLRIHRNELNNQQHLIGILNHFQAKVIECLFDHWGDLSDKAKAKNTDALYSYINYRYGTFAKGRNERLKKAISDHFYVTVVDEDKFIYIKYAELPKHFNQLIPINTNYYKGDLRDLAKKYESPLLLMSYDHLIAELLSQDYRATAVTDETHAYGVFDLQEKKVELYPLKHKGGLLSFCVPFEQTAHLTTHIIGTPYSIFNCQHPIITWYLKQQQYLKKGRLLHQYFEQFFDILCKMNREYTGTSAQLRQNVLSELNAILKKINRQTARDKNPKIKATTFQLTAADFPAWMGAEILNV